MLPKSYQNFILSYGFSYGHRRYGWTPDIQRANLHARALDLSTVPSRRRVSCTLRPRTTTARPISARSKYAMIENQRNQLFDEMTELRKARGPSARTVETARLLLTKQWIKANWRTREQLIKAADWLVRLEGIRGAQSPA